MSLNLISHLCKYESPFHFVCSNNRHQIIEKKPSKMLQYERMNVRKQLQLKE